MSVAQHRSFRKAVAELGVTPSAVSQTVRVLEARIGAALFIRTTRTSKEVIDLAAQGFDAGIRPGHLAAADMVAVPLTPPFRLTVFGNPYYFASHSCVRPSNS